MISDSSAGMHLARQRLLIVAALLAAGALAFAWQEHRTRRALEASLAEARPHPVDIGFAQSMSLHHQQAIAMAQLMLDGRPTPLAPLARAIAGAQLLELGEMRGFLRLWGKPLTLSRPDMSWMLAGPEPPDAALRQYLIDCERSPTGMPGLATLPELERMRHETGRSRDEHFLNLMLAHHEGGIPMARFAARYAHLKVVRDLAARIVLEQSREIDRVRRTLQAMHISLTEDDVE